jgi:hypothetical protein
MAEWDRLASDFVQGECWEFLRPHGFADSTPRLRAFCEAHAVADLRQLDPLTALDRLSTVLYRGLDYERGVTGADSPLDEALEAGRGVCQDFAHIMITIARGWGIPARYLGLSPASAPGKPTPRRPTPGSGLPAVMRWVGLDPTNTAIWLRPSHPGGHRPLFGRSPSRGVFKGDAESSSQSAFRSAARAPTRAGVPAYEHTAARRAAAPPARTATAGSNAVIGSRTESRGEVQSAGVRLSQRSR